jgi:hypothetical protein
MYSCTVLNITGDITISWDNSTSEELKKWVEDKLKSGHTFFIVEKKCFGLINKKKEIKNIESLKNSKGKINLNEDLEKDLFQQKKELSFKGNSKMQELLVEQKQKKVQFTGEQGINNLVSNNVVKTERTLNNSTIKTKTMTSKLKDIMKGNTVCVKPMMGG